MSSLEANRPYLKVWAEREMLWQAYEGLLTPQDSLGILAFDINSRKNRRLVLPVNAQVIETTLDLQNGCPWEPGDYVEHIALGALYARVLSAFVTDEHAIYISCLGFFDKKYDRRRKMFVRGTNLYGPAAEAYLIERGFPDYLKVDVTDEDADEGYACYWLFECPAERLEEVLSWHWDSGIEGYVFMRDKRHLLSDIVSEVPAGDLAMQKLLAATLFSFEVVSEMEAIRILSDKLQVSDFCRLQNDQKISDALDNLAKLRQRRIERQRRRERRAAQE